VARQTRLPIEVIVVDDGSNDETADLVRELASNFGRDWLKLVEFEENQGAASARNMGWSVARGEFVAFLDADDFWHPLKIECQYGYMSSNPDVTLSGHGYQIATDPGGISDLKHPVTIENINPTKLLMFNPFVTPSVMVRTNIPFRFQSGKRHIDDHLLWMEIALSGLRVVKLSPPLALISKPLYGVSGLSSQMWAMEKGELDNYWLLRKEGKIGLPAALSLMMFSLAKYVRRLVITSMRRSISMVRSARVGVL
jgi:glycosyltransferase involved in cell wall biosynthesis